MQRLFVVFFFFAFLCSMFPWFVWNNKISPLLSIFTAIVALISLFFVKKDDEPRSFIFVISLIAMSLWEYHSFNMIGQLIGVMNLICFIVFLYSSHELKQKTLNFITKYFAIFLGISLCCYLLNLMGLFPVKPTLIDYGKARYPSFNYGAFIMPLYADPLDFVRFRSVFMEPGHMNLGTTLLLMANRFNLKNKYVLVIFIVNLFVFSLAGYLTMLAGFLLFNLSIKKIRTLFAAVFFIALGNLAMSATGNGEIMDRYIWNRLEYDESKGSIVGYNRTEIKYDNIYHESISNMETCIFGDPSINSDDYGGNAGYKRYVVTNGFLGVLLVIIFFSSFCIVYRKKDLLALFVVAIMLLFQVSTPLWFCVAFTYIMGVEILRKSDDCMLIVSANKMYRICE